VPNEKGEIHYRNLSSATYRFDIHLPAAGWYLREVALDQKPGIKTESTIARNGISIKLGEKISGIAIAIAEGGASLRGRVTIPEGQSLPPLRIYLAPAERENSDNPLRFFEDAVAADGTFAIANVAPGRFWLLAQPAEQIDATTIKSTRSDGSFRAKVLRAAEALKKEIALKHGSKDEYEDVKFSSEGSKVTVTATIHDAGSDKRGPFFAAYGRDVDDGVMRIEKLKLTIFIHAQTQ